MKKLLAVLLALAVALVLLSGSIAVPLLVRPFFYLQISPRGLAECSGLTEEGVRAAYDDVMDYCLGLRPDFASGELPFSASGASHFEDVRKLFLLDLKILAISLAALVVLLVLTRKQRLRLGGHTPGFWSAVGLGVSFAAIGIFGASDFDRLFVLFHSLFFPGKSNWIFDPAEDAVILILPEEFFASCAALILGVLLAGCAALLVADRRARKKG